MSTYHAPLNDIKFVMNELAGLRQLNKLPGYEDATPDTVEAILDEAGKFASEVLHPLNTVGDREGSRLLEGGTVKTPSGFKDAYLKFSANGWCGLNKNPQYGGQGLPQLVATAIEEMWHGSNLAFALCPMLTQGASLYTLLLVARSARAHRVPNDLPPERMAAGSALYCRRLSRKRRTS